MHTVKCMPAWTSAQLKQVDHLCCRWYSEQNILRTHLSSCLSYGSRCTLARQTCLFAAVAVEHRQPFTEYDMVRSAFGTTGFSA